MNRLLGIGAVAAVVVGFLSFKKGKMDFNFSAEENENCVMCGLPGNFVVEDLPVGPRWFCTEKHFAEYAGLPVKESGYYGFEAEGELEREYFTWFGDKRGGKEWGEYTFTWLNNVGDWKPIEEDTDGWDDWDYADFREQKEYEFVNDMLNDNDSRLYRWVAKNMFGDEETFFTNYKVLNEDGEEDELDLIISWGEPKDVQQKIQYYEKEPLHKLEFLGEGTLEPCPHELGIRREEVNWEGDGTVHVTVECDDCWASGEGHAVIEFEDGERWKDEMAAESKKLPPLEKAEITGIASGATMEGLETLLAAESEIDEKDAQTIAKQAWKKIMTHISENPYLIYDEKEYTGCGHGDGGKREHWWMDEAIDYFRNRVSTTDGYFLLENLIVEEFQDKAQNDTWMKGILRSTLTQMKKQADKMDEDDEWEAFINDVRARADEESWRQKWVAESFAAEDELSGDDTFDIIYHAYGKKFADREHLILGKPLDESEIYDEMDAFVAKMAEVFTIEQLRGGHKKAIEVQEVHIARGGGTMLFPALFRGALERKDWWTDLKDKWEADFPTTRPNCKCGAILEWDNLRKAWYCISCPFNTYKAEMDEKVLLCPHCEDAEATEICEWCKGKECKECFKEHMTDCNYCDGEGEIPRSWVSDSGDRWSPPSLDVTDWELCEYCNEGQVCGDEDIPEFSWDAESFSIQKACHRCGNTEKDGKLWWVGSRKGFICSDCSNGGTKYRAESFEASKWAGFCPKCKKWRTTNMSWWYRADGQYVRDDVPIGVRLCAKRVTRDGYWKDVDGMPHRCDTPLTKGAESLSAKDCDHDKYNVISASEIVGGRRMSVVCVMCDTRGVGEYQYVSSPLDERPHDLTLKEVLDVKWLAAESDGDKQLENGYQCPDCDEGIVYEETYGEEYEDLFVDGSDTTWKYSKIQTCDLCDYVKKEVISTFCENCGEELFSTGEKGKYEKCTCAFGDDFFDVATPFDDSASFSAESDELEESKKRTKMSAIRTGLAITTFSIVMWNLWTNKKQEKDIADIMDLV